MGCVRADRVEFADGVKIVQNGGLVEVNPDEMEDEKWGEEYGREKEKKRRSSDEMRLVGEE